MKNALKFLIYLPGNDKAIALRFCSDDGTVEMVGHSRNELLMRDIFKTIFEAKIVPDTITRSGYQMVFRFNRKLEQFEKALEYIRETRGMVVEAVNSFGRLIR